MANNKKMVNVSLRIDEETKQDFERICDSLGISMSTALSMFVKNVNKTKSIKFLDLVADIDITSQKD